MNRWKIVLSGVAVLACFGCVLVTLVTSAMGQSGPRPVVGAIRWDAWHDGPQNSVGWDVEQILSPVSPHYGQVGQWHWRLPFFSGLQSDGTALFPGTLSGDPETVSAAMEQEIAYAHNDHLDYWAFDYYGTNMDGTTQLTEMNQSFNAYMTSPTHDDIRFALLLQGEWMGDASEWATTMSTFAGYMADSQYQTVLSGRPLIYILDYTSLDSVFGSAAATKTALNQLRTSVSPNAYLVALLDGNSASTAINTYGFDAVSDYAAFPSGQDQTYASLAASNSALWPNEASSAQVIPLVSMGWDPEPRCSPYFAPWADDCNFATSPTPVQAAQQLNAAFTWIGNNSSSAQANAILVYAWDEIDEGGWLIPGLTDGTARLDAVGSAIANYGSAYAGLFLPDSTPYSGLCWNIGGASTAPGGQLYQYQCSLGYGNEQFQFVPAGNGYYTIETWGNTQNLCLDANLGGTTDGSTVEQNTCNSSSAQQFSVNLAPRSQTLVEIHLAENSSKVLALTSTSVGPIVRASYVQGADNQFTLTPFRSVLSGNHELMSAAEVEQCLNVYGDAMGTGEVGEYFCGPYPNSTFNFVNSGGYFQLQPTQTTGECLNIAGDSTSPGDPNTAYAPGNVIQYSCVTGASNELFAANMNLDGTVTLRPQNSTGMCVDVGAGNSYLIQNSCNGSVSQNFVVINPEY